MMSADDDQDHGITGEPRSIDERIESLLALQPPRRRVFIQNWLVCRNGAEAYRQAGYPVKPMYARHEASRLLQRPDVQEIIQLDEKRLGQKLGITHEDIARRWWQIATADVSEIVALHKPPCRYCYGEGQQYQWRTEREFRDAVEAFKSTAVAGLEPEQARDLAARIDDGEVVDPLMPDDAGGYGYTARLPPNPDCPECDGRGGAPMMEITDADQMSDQARMLYDGVKQTQHGIEVQMQDRAKALDSLAKHLGMFREQDADDAINPLQKLAQRIMSNAQTVPVVPDEQIPDHSRAAAPNKAGGHDDVDP